MIDITKQHHNVIYVITVNVFQMLVPWYFFLVSNNFNGGKECQSILNGKPSQNNTEIKSVLCQIIRVKGIFHGKSKASC